LEKEMPIRFRCASCDKMLSIARRKSGSVVNCPTCQAELIVPTETLATVRIDGNGPPMPPAPPAPTQLPLPVAKKKKKDKPKGVAHPTPDFGPPPKSMPLFERPDFEALLSPNSGSPSQPIVASSPDMKPVPAAPLPPMPIPVSQPDEPDVVLVSRGNLTLVAVVMVVLVGLAFAAGYIIAAVTLSADKAA
jgi:phage FluMu protein Com